MSTASSSAPAPGHAVHPAGVPPPNTPSWLPVSACRCQQSTGNHSPPGAPTPGTPIWLPLYATSASSVPSRMRVAIVCLQTTNSRRLIRAGWHSNGTVAAQPRPGRPACARHCLPAGRFGQCSGRCGRWRASAKLPFLGGKGHKGQLQKPPLQRSSRSLCFKLQAYTSHAALQHRIHQSNSSASTPDTSPACPAHPVRTPRRSMPAPAAPISSVRLSTPCGGHRSCTLEME